LNLVLRMRRGENTTQHARNGLSVFCTAQVHAAPGGLLQPRPSNCH
jgi:hypothetical protein